MRVRIGEFNQVRIFSLFLREDSIGVVLLWIVETVSRVVVYNYGSFLFLHHESYSAIRIVFDLVT